MYKWKQLPGIVRFAIDLFGLLVIALILFLIGMAVYAKVMGISYNQAFDNLTTAIRGASNLIATIRYYTASFIPVA